VSRTRRDPLMTGTTRDSSGPRPYRRERRREARAEVKAARRAAKDDVRRQADDARPHDTDPS
jgi:hypothetical protein